MSCSAASNERAVTARCREELRLAAARSRMHEHTTLRESVPLDITALFLLGLTMGIMCGMVIATDMTHIMLNRPMYEALQQHRRHFLRSHRPRFAAARRVQCAGTT